MSLLDRLSWRRDEVVAAPAATRPAVVARAYVYLFGLGALLGASLPALPGDQLLRPLLLWGSVGLALLTAAGLLVRFEGTPEAVLRLLPSVGALLVGAAMLAAVPEVRPGYAMFLFGAVLAAAFFVALPGAAVDLVLAVVVLAGSLAEGGGEGWEAVGLAGSVTLIVFCLLTSSLRNRTETLILALGAEARTDALTGLLNRRGLEAALYAALDHARRTDHCCTLLALDVDGLKAINDTLGHAAGDEALRAVAETLTSGRRSDAVARVGGDEFQVVLGETDLEGARMIAHRLLDDVAARAPVRVSMGVACFPVHGQDATVLREHADQALYDAKALGGGRVVVFDAPASRGR